MKRGLKITLSMAGAIGALALLLIGAAVASSTLPGDSLSALPPARPHSPSSGVYTLYDTLTPSDVPTATYQWIEINDSADYVWHLGGDFREDGDVSPRFPIGFYFAFYDDFYTHFRVSEKGYIFFEKPGVNIGSGEGLPETIPTDNVTGTDAANNFIAPFAADLFGYPGISRVYVRNDAAPRRVIVEFENMVWCCGLYNPRTFQVILYPDGDIQMQYRKITDFAGTLDQDLNSIVRVGLENLDGSVGDVYTQGLFIPDAADFWQDEMAIRFERSLTDTNAVFLPDSRRVWDDPGRSITTTSNLYLGASEAVTRSFNLSYALAVSSHVPITPWASGIVYPASIAAITGTYSATLSFVVSVPDTVTDVNDMATVTFTACSTDTVPMITATYAITYGPAHRDLQMEKTLHPNIPPADGGAFRYRLVITNTDFDGSDRAAIARGVVVTDVLPVGITYEDCHRAFYYGWCGTAITTGTLGARTAITLNLGAMDVDQVETIWLELRNHSLSGLISNTAYVTTTDSVELGYGANNRDSESFAVAAFPVSELYVNKDYPHHNNFVAAGQAIPYNIYFYNNGREGYAGNALLYDVVVFDTLPENTTFDRAVLNYNGPAWSTEGPITPTVSGPMSRTLAFTIPVVDNGSWNVANLQLWVNVPPTISLGTRLTNTVIISDGVSFDRDVEVVEIASHYIDPFVDKEPSRDAWGNVILPEPGKDYTYWITYGNRSVLTNAVDVIITDTLPPSVTLVSASSALYLTGPVTSTLPGEIVQITWYTDTAPGLPPGYMGQIAVVVHVDSDVPRGTELANQVVITYSGEFTPSTTLDDRHVLTVEVASDIYGSRKLVDNETPGAGDTVEYTVVVSNASLSNTIGFTVTDPLPPELCFAGYDPPSTGNVLTGSNAILWMGQVISNSETALVFRATVTEAAQINSVIRNTAYITTDNGLSVARWVDVTVAHGVFGNSSKVASASEVASGGGLTYTITLRNSGSAGGVLTVTDSLPPSVTLVAESFSPLSELPNVISSGNTLTWTTVVSAMGSKSLDFQVTVTEGLADGVEIWNIAMLDDGLSSEPIPLTATVTISNPPPLRPDFAHSSKVASPGAVPGGGTITYTLVVSNSGDASGIVTLTDALPPSVTLVAESFSPLSELPNVISSGNTLTWTTVVSAMDSKSLDFQVTVTEGLSVGVTIENVVYLDDSFSPSAIPLTATVTIISPPGADLYLPAVFKNSS